MVMLVYCQGPGRSFVMVVAKVEGFDLVEMCQFAQKVGGCVFFFFTLRKTNMSPKKGLF